MIQLTTPEYASALPLLANIKQKVLPTAICQGTNPGMVFVDCKDNPRTTLIWTTVGYYFLAGDPSRSPDFARISQTLNEVFIPSSQERGETGFILIPSTGEWKEYLPILLPGREVIEIYRRPFAFNPVQFAMQGSWQERIPQGYHIEAVDTALAEQVGILASWDSIEGFLAYGLGYALLDGDDIASACTSVFASNRMMEIDVHTTEKYRRRGFATITASAFIQACLQRGLEPNWECFWDNEPSTILANKLGFSALPDYPVYNWEV